MDIQALMTYAGMVSTGIGALVMAKAAWRLNTAKVWKEEAQAQKERADRLQNDMDEIKARLASIEAKNERLVQLLTALDPEKLAALHI